MNLTPIDDDISLSYSSIIFQFDTNEEQKKQLQQFHDFGSFMEIILCTSDLQMMIGTNEGEHSFLIELLFQESTLVRLLTILMGHFDSLLEDWYPKLRNRFVQNAKDDYLINLFIPCHRCLTEFNSTEKPLCQTFWLEMLMMLIEKQQEIKWEILALIRTGKLLCLLYKSWDSNMLE